MTLEHHVSIVIGLSFFEYLRETLYKYALEHLIADRPSKCLTIVGPVIGRDIFSARALVLGP